MKISLLQGLRKQCQDFATALLDHTRSSYELEVLLNYDPEGPAHQVSSVYRTYPILSVLYRMISILY